MATSFLVDSPNVKYTQEFIEAKYTYGTVQVCQENGVTKVRRGHGVFSLWEKKIKVICASDRKIQSQIQLEQSNSALPALGRGL